MSAPPTLSPAADTAGDRPPTPLLRPLGEPDEVKAAMTAARQTLEAILDPADWHGPPGAEGSFIKKSGWRKAATAFGISVRVVRDRVERDRDGAVSRADALVRATAPNGQSFEGDGYCSADEARFAEPRGRQTVESDVRATATTRAANRAIASLVGFGETAEGETPAPPQALPPAWARHAPPDGEQHKAFRQALGRLLGGDVERCSAMYTTAWRHHDDGIPTGLAAFVISLEAQQRAVAA